MDPAVEFGVGLHFVMADDGLSVEIVFYCDKEEPEHDEQRAGLVVELE